jgi:hypothetical protein
MDIIISKSMLDEEHDVGSIWHSVPLNDSILDLIEDEIHHIKGKVLSRVRQSGTLMSKSEEINKRGANGIIVATTRSNVFSENADMLIIEWMQAIDEAHNTCGFIEVIELVLVRLGPWIVNTVTHWSVSIIRIPQERGKRREVRCTLMLAGHPLHRLLSIG